MKINPSLKARPIASFFQAIFSLSSIHRNLCLGLAILAFGALGNSAQAQAWIDEKFTSLAASSPLTTGGNLVFVGSTGFATGAPEGGALRILKTTGSATSVRWALSDNPLYSTPRPSGYITFKIQQTPGVAPLTSSYMTFRVGANDANNLNGQINGWFEARFYNMPFVASPGSSTANLMVYPGQDGAGGPGAKTGNYSINNGSSPVKIEVWYNNTAAPINYISPATGVAVALAPNTFVLYAANVLITPAATGTSFGTSTVNTIDAKTTVPTAPAVTADTIGKIGFVIGSSQTGDFIIDDIYAANSAPVLTTPPVITSAASSTGYQNVEYSYKITTDQLITSYALSGALPAGLTFDTKTGTISGTPSALGTTSNIGLTASNANGPSAVVNLAITIRIPINTFSGTDTSLNNALSWSLGAAPNSSSSEGSYQNVILDSTVTGLTSTSSSLSAKSWNVNNGKSYTLTSGKTDGSSTFRMGITSPSTTTFANAVSGVDNDLVYLANNSSLTFSPLNSISALTPSKVELFNSGNLNIGSGSTLNIDAATAGSYAITKTGAGTVGLSAANTYSEGTTLSAGTMNISGSAAPTRLAQVQANVVDGVVTGYTVIDGGAGYTAVPTVLISYEGTGIPFPKATATAEISNGAVTAVRVVEGGSGYVLAPKVQIFSNQSPLGTGTVTLSGGTLNASVDTDLSRMSFFPNPYNNFFRITGKDTAILGPVTLDVADGKTLSSFTLVSNSNPDNLITKNGQGTLWLRGGATPADEPGIAFAGGFRVNAGTLSISVTANSGTGTGTITMNGGNLRIGKGVGSNGDYSALDMNNRISVLLDTTITLDPNPRGAAGSNLASAAVLQSKASKTITVAKSSTANPGAQMIFRTAELEGTTIFNVADATQVVLGGATSTGSAGVTKTGLGTLMLSVLNSSTTPSTIMNNSYTGATAINAGTVSFYPGSTQASSISVASGAVAQFTLGNAIPTTSGSLTLSTGSKVRIIGNPASSASPYTLFTAADGITGTPVLETAISGYALTKSSDGKSLILDTSSVTDSYLLYLSSNGLLADTAFNAKLNGVTVGLKYAFGSANGMPQDNGITALPVVGGNQLTTYTFDVKEDSALTVTYQTSTDLVTWTTAQAVSTGTGSSPAGFVKKQAQATGSGKLFIRISVTR